MDDLCTGQQRGKAVDVHRVLVRQDRKGAGSGGDASIMRIGGSSVFAIGPAETVWKAGDHVGLAKISALLIRSVQFLI